MTVNVLLEDSFDGHQGNDLYDPEHALYRVFRVRKNATLHDFIELLSDTLVSLLLLFCILYNFLNIYLLLEKKKKNIFYFIVEISS